jgi:hypothetical protein
VRGELVVMCEEMLFMEANDVQTKEHGRKLCVTNSCSGIHGMISMNKPLGVFIKIVVPFRSTIGVVSNFKYF